jgi:hypothetical protein
LELGEYLSCSVHLMLSCELTHSFCINCYCPATVADPREAAFSAFYSSVGVPGRVLQSILVFRVLELGEYLSCSVHLMLSCELTHSFCINCYCPATVADPREAAFSSVGSSVRIPGRVL